MITVHNKRFGIFLTKIVFHLQKTTKKPVFLSKKSCYECLKWNGATFSYEMTGATFLILGKNCFPCCARLISFCVYFARYIVGTTRRSSTGFSLVCTTKVNTE